MARVILGFRRILLAAVLLLIAAVGTRAQAPEFGYWERTPLPQAGLATFYNPGLMEQVQDYRLIAGEIDACPECVGSVALLRAGDIGRRVWLKPPGGDPVGPFLVVDCARRQDVQPLLDRNWVVDVSYQVGQYWGMNRPLDGVIVFEDPADEMPGRSTNRIPTPFYVPPGDVIISAPTATPAESIMSDAPPTAWPTRLPVPMVPILETDQGAEIAPTNSPIPPTPTAIWPPPLTPIITTPTPAVTPEASTPTAVVLSPDGIGASLPDLSPSPTPSPTEVALGRAGGGVLGLGNALPHRDGPDRDKSTTRPTLVRSPRPIMTPLLPHTATPTAAPTPDAGFLDRLLKGLIDFVR